MIKWGQEIMENTQVEEMINRAALSARIAPRHWEVNVENRAGVIAVHCSSKTPREAQASIHFGNQEWMGTVNNDSTDFGDQWNGAVDDLAVIGRDEATNSPKCSFDVVLKTGQIPFPKRAMRETWTVQDVCVHLAEETYIKLPFWKDFKVYKEGSPETGLWTDGNYQLVHKTLDPARGAPVVAPPDKSAIFGIFNE
jgi:hypothetical protein